MRLNNWQLHYSDFYNSRLILPFVWGSNDCALFAVDCVKALTGYDHGVKFRGYTTARQAKHIVDRFGGLYEIASKALGEPTTPAYAAVGDVVLIEIADSLCLGVSNGSVCIGPGKDGIISLANSAIQHVWKI